MFSNIGVKIKTWAKVLCWIGIAGAVILGIGIILSGGTMGRYGYSSRNVSLGSFFLGLLVIVVAGFASWVSSFLLYGFGELIDTCQEIEHLLTPKRESRWLEQNEERGDSSTTAPAALSGSWRCNKCGASNPYGQRICKDCGAVE